jgi:glycosyltransferase involved in cell wall biosynthesis
MSTPARRARSARPRRTLHPHGFKLSRVERFLPTNTARNVALRHASGKYVVFVENDVVVSENWLSTLVACAEETGATVVSPLICKGRRSTP